MTCRAINYETGARCVRGGHEGPHRDARGRSWPTQRERSGDFPARDTSLDLALVERGEVDGEEVWWIMPTPERVENGATKGVPTVMYAFRDREIAETVCLALNTSALCDAMGTLADDREVAAA